MFPRKVENLTDICFTDCSLLLIDLAGCIGGFPDPGSRTDSQGCQRLVKTWVDQCITLHRSCRPSLNSTTHIPGRLLDLLPGNKIGGYFAVVEGVSREEDCRYACLSHCWGGEQPLKLTKDTAEELANGLSVENLPPTFRDAVTVCGWLDIQYLWIDSLCILQDSEDDWITQSFQMRSIFKNAYLTIAATHGSTCQSGLFSARNPVTSVIPFGQVTSLDSAVEDQIRSVTVVDTLLWETAVENSPLNRRAWVLQVCSVPCKKNGCTQSQNSSQERFLSPRILHFGSEQLFWECTSNQACETFPASYPRHTSNNRPKLPFKNRTLSRDTRSDATCQKAQEIVHEDDDEDEEIVSHRRLLSQWIDMYEYYTRRQITYDSDRIPAFAGIAEEYQSLICKPYVAGIWNIWIEWQLLWRTKNPSINSRFVPNSAPSWSWLSIKGDIVGPDLIPKQLLVSKVHTMGATLKDPKLPFGDNKSGYIKSNAFIAPFPDNVVPLRTIPAEDEIKHQSKPNEHRIYLDTNLTASDLQRCSMFPLVLVVSAYSGPQLTGLLITPLIEGSDHVSVKKFSRIGMFEAKDQRVCEILKHQRCNGHGCVFTRFKADEESPLLYSSAINYREQYNRIQERVKRDRKKTRVIEENLAKSFIDKHLKRQLITIL